MGTSKSQPNDWMTKDGTGKSTVFGDERGWVRVQPDGQEVVIHCMTGVTGLTQPEVTSVDNPAPGDYTIGVNLIRWSVYFDEDVVVTGIPVVKFDEAGVQQEAVYSSGSSTASMLSFEFTGTTVGVIDNVITSIDLAGGTIVSDDDGSAVDLAFPNDYVQPTGVNVIA